VPRNHRYPKPKVSSKWHAVVKTTREGLVEFERRILSCWLLEVPPASAHTSNKSKAHEFPSVLPAPQPEGHMAGKSWCLLFNSLRRPA
jgi:hypothetical protein